VSGGKTQRLAVAPFRGIFHGNKAFSSMEEYDPFVRGGFSVGVRTVELHDGARKRTFPCEIWYPAPLGRQIEDQHHAADALFR
jgi:hypothetical protein